MIAELSCRTVSRKNGRPLRKGFTLVELLVVIGIVGFLAALLLPAIQQARELARRLQCTSQLRQQAIAVLNYEATFRYLPTQYTGALESNPFCQAGFTSWVVPLLPYLEHSNLAGRIDSNIGMADTGNQGSSSGYETIVLSANHPNAKVAATRLPFLICPSEAVQNRTAIGTANAAPSSYAANAGWPKGASLSSSSEVSQQINGAIGIYNPKFPDRWQVEQITLASFLDGTANTALISERVVNNVDATQTAFGLAYSRIENLHPGMFSFCGGGPTDRTLDRWINYCGGVSAPDPHYSEPLGNGWISGWTSVGNTYMHVFTPNRRSCHIYGGEGNGNNIVTAGSRHVGGTNLVMADASVRFVDQNIDRVSWWSIGSRNGGEAPSEVEGF